MKKIILQKGKEKSLQRFHPWVFSGAVAKKDKTLADGDVVAVYNYDGQFMAVGHYHNSSTCVKIFSFEEVEPDEVFWREKVRQAVMLRRQLGLMDNPRTTCCRLINGEGDYLPGLIVPGSHSGKGLWTWSGR